MDNLEAAIDLTEEVNIPDNELKRATGKRSIKYIK